jgi:glycosyltransferase involved in cell wall biosynthesis
MSVHDGALFLCEAIDSILKQTFRDFELIVIDDASTDDTPKILREVSDPRLRLITLTQNVGLVDALNHAIAEARGVLIARMDADDVAHPQRFAAQVERMMNDPDLVLLGTSFDYIGAQGMRLRPETLHADNETIQRELIEQGNQFCHPSVMIRLNAVRSVGGYRKLAGRYAQDYDLWLRLAETGTVGNLTESLLKYRVHGGQLSLKKLFPQRRAAEIYRVLAKQRRLFGFEDLAMAVKEVDSKKRFLRKQVAADILRWSDLFSLMGRAKRARIMRMKAILVGTPSPADVQPLLRRLWGRLRLLVRC